MSQARLLWLLATLVAVPAAAQGGTACVQGRVYGSFGSPLMGARVTLLNAGTAVMTDLEGRYAFLSLLPDTVSLRVTYIGYKSGMVSGLRLEAGKPVTQDFTLEQSKVTITPMGDAPLPAASAPREGRPQPPTVIESERTCPKSTASSPTRMIDGVPVDTSARFREVMPIAVQTAGAGSSPRAAKVLIDGVPQQVNRRPLSGTACLQGRVFSGPGVPLPGARVVLVNPQIATITDAAGQYSFWSLAPDTVSVRVSYLGYKAALVSGLRLSADRIVSQDFTLEASPVTVTEFTPPPGKAGRQASAAPSTRPVETSLCESSTTTPEVTRLPDGSYVDRLPANGVPLVLRARPGTPVPAPGRLEGTVMAIGRQPLWGASVYIVGSLVSASTDTTGRYRFDFVPAGAITLYVQAAGSNPATVEGVRIRAGETVVQDFVLVPGTPGGNSMNRTEGTRLEFVYVDALPPGARADSAPGRIEGTIRDGSNRPVVDARVVIIGTMESARTDSAGRYVLPLVRSGMLTLRATRDGYAMTQVEGLRLNRGATLVQDFQLLSVPAGRP